MSGDARLPGLVRGQHSYEEILSTMPSRRQRCVGLGRPENRIQSLFLFCFQAA